jgi:hypothetical protein
METVSRGRRPFRIPIFGNQATEVLIAETGSPGLAEELRKVAEESRASKSGGLTECALRMATCKALIECIRTNYGGISEGDGVTEDIRSRGTGPLRIMCAWQIIIHS